MMVLDDYDKMRRALWRKNIVDVLPGNDFRQNDFILVFSDGSRLEVTAIGDDMTYIEVNLRS